MLSTVLLMFCCCFAVIERGFKRNVGQFSQPTLEFTPNQIEQLRELATIMFFELNLANDNRLIVNQAIVDDFVDFVVANHQGAVAPPILDEGIVDHVMNHHLHFSSFHLLATAHDYLSALFRQWNEDGGLHHGLVFLDVVWDYLVRQQLPNLQAVVGGVAAGDAVGVAAHVAGGDEVVVGVGDDAVGVAAAGDAHEAVVGG
ncbi:hypothetical protein OROMI_032988 [Orobanche minor]